MNIKIENQQRSGHNYYPYAKQHIVATPPAHGLPAAQ